ncbi:MAG: hypothetical protein IJ560_02600 [Alphaproteobacteria bacterium]|nr:hypothetical protein [Alphaproteobacteria bacterium]
MHFTKTLVGFITVFCAFPSVFAATARPSVLGAAGSRMPTMTAYVNNLGTTTTTAATSSLLANTECIDAYTSCIKGTDACGPNFEECTTRVLFHAKMPQCLSTLAQCNTAGISSLFGTGATTALSTVSTKNSYGEVTDYTYPTDGSVLGQMITGAAIANKYDTSTCVKRYTSCLRKDTVCGNDFELCTTNTEFRKQRVYCDSTLARCQSDGLIELFGSTTVNASPTASSRIGAAISEGAALAAVNAVATCYKVVDQCIKGACTANPYKCTVNSRRDVADIVQQIVDGTLNVADVNNDMISNSDVSAYIRNSCQDTIGSNKYCYATFIGNGQMPTASQLADEDNQSEIYAEAYSARMNDGMRAQLAELMNQFDTKAKKKCTETIRSCAMRTCGGGLGSVCYSQVYSDTNHSINVTATRDEIKTGCESVVNTDMYCKYAAANPSGTGSYTYSYIDASAFDKLFPDYDSGDDPIGVVASLNASLANNYSDAAIAQMKKQCQSIATSCVKSLCGTDYVNCYRNRTDIYSSLTNTGDNTYDRSMNKVGGVLDYTVVLGLCLDTVKNASVCEEHLAIEAAKIRTGNSQTTSSWGNRDNVRDGWIDAGAATSVTASTEQVDAVDENGNKLCSSRTGEQGTCYTVDSAGNVFDQPVRIAYTTYVQSQAATSLFKDLIYDIEKEAQAKYNAKLTKQQNICLAKNAEAGGIMGNRENGSAYQWVKLRSNKTPKGYAVSGLKDNQFVVSNDLYGSFCRIRVTIQSDDKKIQEKIRSGASWATAYFAVGDWFTCGSWIPEKDLSDIANTVAGQATEQQAKVQNRWRNWLTVAGVLGTGVGGYYLTDSLQDGKLLGGLLGNGNKKETSDYKDVAKKCVDKLGNPDSQTDVLTGVAYARQMSGVDGAESYDLDKRISELERSMNTYNTTSDKKTVTRTVTVTSDGKRTILNPEYTSACNNVREEMSKWLNSAYENPNDCQKPMKAAMDSFSCDVVNEISGIENKIDNALDKTIHWNTTGPKKAQYDGKTCRNVYLYAGLLQAVNKWKTLQSTKEVDESTASNQQKQEVIDNPDKMVNRSIYAGDVLALRAACQMIADDGINDDAVVKAERKRAVTNLVGAGVTAVAGGILINRLTNDIQKTALEKAQQEAYDEWMNAVGNHITCYVGSDEIGPYGTQARVDTED